MEIAIITSPAPDVVYRGDGDCINYPPDEATPAGSVVAFGSGIGVTKLDIPAGTLGTLHLVGQYDFPKASGTAFAFGAGLEWDAANKQMIATTGTPQAYVCAPAKADDAKVRGVLA